MKRTCLIDFDGKSVEVRVNFDFIDRVEERFDLMSFVNSVRANKPRIKDIAWVIYSALRASGINKEYSEVGQIVMDDFTNAAAAAGEIVLAALASGPEKKPVAQD
jgi:hypothetical protein